MVNRNGSKSRGRRKEKNIYLTADDIARAFDVGAMSSADEAEMALLGGAFHAEESAEILRDLDASHYRTERHRTIHNAITASTAVGSKADIVLVNQRLADDQTLEQIGGTDYLAELAESVPNGCAAAMYAKEVCEAARKRRVAETLGKAVWRIVEGGDETDSVISETVGQLDKESEPMQTATIYRGLQDCRAIDWLWPRWLPIGMPVILAAEPTTGKSFAAVDLAARLSKGKLWPDGWAMSGRASTIYLSREMDAHHMVNPRYAAAGGEPGCLIHDSAPFSLDEMPSRLRRMANAHARAGEPPVKLVVVDPVGSYIAGSDGNSYSDVYTLMSSIADAARSASVAVLLVLHLNKRSPGKAGMDRLMGSVGWRGAARVVWAMERDRDENGDEIDDALRMTLAESNIGKSGDSIPFELIKAVGGVHDQLAIRWGDPEKRKRAEVLRETERPKQSDRRTSERKRVGEIAAQMLAGGPVKVSEVLKRTREAELEVSEKTIKRELSTLGAVARLVSIGSPWVWEIPPHTKELSTLSTLVQTSRVDSSGGSQDSPSGQSGQSGQQKITPREHTEQQHELGGVLDTRPRTA